MERNEFIKSLGLGLALVCTGSCMSGCGKGGEAAPDKSGGNNNPGGSGGSTTATANLSTQLLAIGDQLTVGSVLFIRTAAGNATSSFVATEAICPHQGGNLVWKQNLNLIQCQLHFSEYNTNGTVAQGPQNTTGTTRTLKIYATSVSGTTLTATIA